MTKRTIVDTFLPSFGGFRHKKMKKFLENLEFDGETS